MEKRGYQFAKPPLPPEPKKVTPASVRRLMGITTPKLYQQSEFISPITGEIVPGSQGKATQRSIRIQFPGYEKQMREAGFTSLGEMHRATDYQPPRQADVILRNVRDSLNRWFPDPSMRPAMEAQKKADVSTARSILADAIASIGEDAVAANLDGYGDRIYEILEAIEFASDSHGTVSAALAEFTQIVTGHSLSMLDNLYITERAERMATEDDYYEE